MSIKLDDQIVTIIDEINDVCPDGFLAAEFFSVDLLGFQFLLQALFCWSHLAPKKLGRVGYLFIGHCLPSLVRHCVPAVSPTRGEKIIILVNKILRPSPFMGERLRERVKKLL
jgi:hypothetical protein